MAAISTYRTVRSFVLAGLLLGAAIAAADPTDFGDNNVPTSTIEFTDDSNLGGRSARFEGTVSQEGQRLIVKGLNVMSPLVIHIFSKDPDKRAAVSLHRYFWGKADAEGTTDSRGDWQYRGRAHDEVGIALSVNEPTPVYALVWQGPAAPAAAVPTVVVNSSRSTAESASGESSLLTISIVALLAIIVVLLAVLVFRKRPATVAGAIVLALLTGELIESPALAQSSPSPVPNPFVDEGQKSEGDTVPDPFADDQTPPDEYKPDPIEDKPGDAQDGSSGDNKLEPDPSSQDKPRDSADSNAGDNKLKPDANANKPQDGDNKLKPDPNADKPRDGDSKLKPDPNANKPQDGDNKLKPDTNANKPRDGDTKLKPDSDPDKPNPDGDSETREASTDSEDGSSDGSTGDGSDGGSAPDSGSPVPFDDRLEAAYAQIRQLRSEIASNSARISALEFLIQQDRDAVPEPGDGAPPISVACEDDPACQACLASANGTLSELLINLDKLRIIYVSYMRYKDFMVGLGDSISGFHQLEQAAWYRTKLQIEEATIGLQGAYDNKFDEYKVLLSQTLQELSACSSSSGDPTFSRESILFENYVKAKYARED